MSTGDVRRTTDARTPVWVAGVLSLVAPGVGHLYAGAPARGATAWVARRVLGLAALALVVLVPGPVGLIAYALASCALLGAVAVDAVRTARIRPSRQRWYDRPIVYLAACVGVTMATIGWSILVDSRVADRLRVPTETMAPTIMAGERLFVAPRGGHAIRRGDLIVYKRWETRYVKRVVGLPGDTLAMRAGVLSIDGRSAPEPQVIHDGEGETTDPRFAWQRNYLAATDESHYAPTLATWGPLIVPRDAYFVLGDDRGQSIDSRYDGFLADSSFLGRPITIYFSRDPATGRIRWRRIGTALHRDATSVPAPRSPASG